MTMPPSGADAPLALSRRTLIASAAASGLALTAGGAARAATAATPPVRAIAFDGFVIFDVRSVPARLEEAYPGKGAALFAAWSAKLFGYTWLATSAGQYQDFDTLADKSLAFAAQAMGLAMDGATRTRLVGAFAAVDIWPDVKPALARLRAAGVRLAFLSDLSAALINANCARTGIADYFETPLTTDRVRAFKPSPLAYGMAPRAFGLPVDQIGFAAFGGWDAVGAHWFGYCTAWINRLGVPAETIETAPAIIARGMEGVLALAGL